MTATILVVFRRLCVALSLSSVAWGCKPQEETELPICKAEVAGSEAREVQTGQVPHGVWFAIMLRDFDRNTSQVKRPARDCSGRAIEPETVGAACPVEETTLVPPPAHPLGEDDLVLQPTDDGRFLVWVTTSRFETGEAIGPVALAEWTKRGVAIRTLGTLRAHSHRAAMRLEPMGDGRVLVVESRVCETDDPNECFRQVRLVPIEGDRFVERPLVSGEGQCIGPAAFEMYRAHQVVLETGLRRSFELTRSIDFTDGNVVIGEQVTIKDSDPAQPDAPAKLFRQASIQRPLHLAEAGLVTQRSLWESMLAEHGSVQLAAGPEHE